MKRLLLLLACIFISYADECKEHRNECKKPYKPCLKPEMKPTGCVPDLFKRSDQIMSAHAEFLLWSAATGDLDFCIKMRRDAWGNSNSYAQGRFENASYGLDPGFRVGLLYFRAPHFWETRWQYTRETISGKDEAKKPGSTNQFLTGTWPQVFSAPMQKATSHIHLNYNLFEWMITRVFFPNPHLRLRLIGGSVVVWMDQDWKVRYKDDIVNTTTIRNRWEYVGAGLKMGTEFDWFWTKELYMTGWGFFGSTLGSYSNKSTQKTDFQPTPSDNTTVPIRHGSYQDTRPSAFIQMLVGPSIQKNYVDYRLELFAGFELTSWFNLQEVFRSSAGAPSAAKQTWINSSMFALYGLSTRVTLDF